MELWEQTHVTVLVIALAVPLLLWAIASYYTGWVAAMFLPTPIAVIQAGVQLWQQEALALDIFASFTRVAGGFLLPALMSYNLCQ